MNFRRLHHGSHRRHCSSSICFRPRDTWRSRTRPTRSKRPCPLRSRSAGHRDEGRSARSVDREREYLFASMASDFPVSLLPYVPATILSHIVKFPRMDLIHVSYFLRQHSLCHRHTFPVLAAVEEVRYHGKDDLLFNRRAWPWELCSGATRPTIIPRNCKWPC